MRQGRLKVGVRHMHDERVVAGAAFGCKYERYGLCVVGIGGQAVHGFGGQAQQFARF
jgi:hypothetical protein